LGAVKNSAAQARVWFFVQTKLQRMLPVRVPMLVRAAPVLALAMFFPLAEANATERWATLEAIHQLENPNDKPQPGPCGELGAYQFREETWRMHTYAPFSRALDRRESDAVAVKHYDWLKTELIRRGIEVTPYTIGLAWNGGLRAVTEAAPPASVVDYASRVANLASDFQSHELALAR
jgi:hypothetical protein